MSCPILSYPILSYPIPSLFTHPINVRTISYKFSRVAFPHELYRQSSIIIYLVEALQEMVLLEVNPCCRHQNRQEDSDNNSKVYVLQSYDNEHAASLFGKVKVSVQVSQHQTKKTTSEQDFYVLLSNPTD